MGYLPIATLPTVPAKTQNTMMARGTALGKPLKPRDARILHVEQSSDRSWCGTA